MEKEGREREEKQSDYYISICLSSDLFLYGNVLFSSILLLLLFFFFTVLLLAADCSVEPTGLLLLLLPIVKSSGR